MTTAARPAPAAARAAAWRQRARLLVDGPADDALLRVLAVAALSELLLLRLFTRTAIHIPALEDLAGPYHVVSAVGRYAYYAAVVLLVLGLVVVARPRTAATPVERQAAAAAGAFVLVALAARAGVLGADDGALVATATTAIVGVLAAVVGVARRGWARVALWCFAGAFTASGTHAVIQELSGAGLRMDTRGSFLLAAEILGLAAALLVPLAAGIAPTRRDGWTAAAVGVLALGAFVAAGGSTARILALWNFGLGGYLPSVAYAVAVAAVALGLSASRRGASPWAVIGTLLLVSGGIGLHSTYQTGLVVMGLALLARSPAGRPAPAA